MEVAVFFACSYFRNISIQSKRFRSKTISIIFSKYFTVDSKTKNGLNRYVYNFSVDYNTIGVNDIIDIHKFLLKKRNIKQCLD